MQVGACKDVERNNNWLLPGSLRLTDSAPCDLSRIYYMRTRTRQLRVHMAHIIDESGCGNDLYMMCRVDAFRPCSNPKWAFCRSCEHFCRVLNFVSYTDYFLSQIVANSPNIRRVVFVDTSNRNTTSFIALWKCSVTIRCFKNLKKLLNCFFCLTFYLFYL